MLTLVSFQIYYSFVFLFTQARSEYLQPMKIREEYDETLTSVLRVSYFYICDYKELVIQNIGSIVDVMLHASKKYVNCEEIG